MVPTTAPAHTCPAAPTGPPRDGGPRARRTHGIVNEIRDALAGTTGRQVLVDELIEANLGVARSIAGRYRNRGIDLDDLEQVALLGLTKAAHRFDAGAGHDFLSYAVPTVRGELRRHFRDSGWVVRPPRRVQELQARIFGAEDELAARLGRSARPSEVAAHLQVDLADVVEALTADGCFSPASLDVRVGEGASTLGDLLPFEDRRITQAEARIVLAPGLRVLSPRDQRIVRLRFYEERTQQEIAEAVGLTQAQVSRVLNRILRELRAGLAEPLPAA